VPSGCNFIGLLILLKLCPVFTFLQQLMTKNCELFTHTLVLQCSPSTSSHQPQTNHVFADSMIALLCHTLRICVTHAPTEFCPFFLSNLGANQLAQISFFLFLNFIFNLIFFEEWCVLSEVERNRPAAVAGQKKGIKCKISPLFDRDLVSRGGSWLTFAAARPGGHQSDTNLCGVCARPTDKHSLARGGGGYNQVSHVYFAKGCGGWVFAGVNRVVYVDIEGSNVISVH